MPKKTKSRGVLDLGQMSNMTVRPVFNPAFRGVMGDVFPFSMDRIFAAGELGLWYEPSDLTTLFQDAFGATPVTAPGQTVGLMLDKSKGLTFGPDSVVNGAGNTLAGWTNPTGWWTSTGGRFYHAASSVYNELSQTFAAASGPAVIEFDAEVLSAANTAAFAYTNAAGVVISGAQFNIPAGVSRYRRVVLDGIQRIIISRISGQTANFYVDNISVRSLSGFHATQSTALSRPTYGIAPETGRRNLMLLSDAFSPTGGVGGGAVNNGDGSVTFSASGQSAFKTVAPTSISSGVVVTLSVTLSGTGTINLGILSGGGAVVNPIPVTLTSTPTRYTNTITNPSTGVNCGLAINSTSAGTCAIARIQFELGPIATAYQRVTTKFDVTEAGVPSLDYLFFGGAADARWMVTPTITPGVDKVQVFVGIQKLSDAARGTVVELSASSDSNNGAMHLTAPNAASNTFAFESKGTALADAVASGVSAPATRVMTGLGDISGDSAIIRLNGVQSDADVGDQGTGNYLAYPMYIGRRGGTSLPLNGNIYSLVVRFGPNLSGQRVRQVEHYVAEKTGVQL